MKNTYWIQLSYDIKNMQNLEAVISRSHTSLFDLKNSSRYHTQPLLINLQISSKAISNESSIFSRHMYVEISTAWTPSEARDSAARVLWKCYWRPGLFHWPWDTYYTLREPFKQLNWLDQPSTSKQYFPALGWLNSWIEDKFSQHIFFNFDLEFKKLWWSSKQKFDRQLHVSTRNTLPSTASHKHQYSKHWSIISKDSFTTLSLFHEVLSNLIAA